MDPLLIFYLAIAIFLLVLVILIYPTLKKGPKK